MSTIKTARERFKDEYSPQMQAGIGEAWEAISGPYKDAEIAELRAALAGSSAPSTTTADDTDVCHSPACDDRCSFPRCMGPAPEDAAVERGTSLKKAAQDVLRHFDVTKNEFWSRFPSTFKVLAEGKLNALRAALAATEVEAAPVTAGEIKTWQKRMPCPPGSEASRVTYMEAEISDLRAALAERGTVGEPVAYRQRMVAPNGNTGPWGNASEQLFNKYRNDGDIGDGFKYEVRALGVITHPAPVGDVGLPVQASIDTPEFAELLWAFQFHDDERNTERRAALVAYIDSHRAHAAPQVAQVVAGGLTDAAGLYATLRAMHWTDKKLAVIEVKDVPLGVQTYCGDMLDEAILAATKGASNG